MIKASNLRSREANTLIGFVELKLESSGLMLHECSVHERDGKRWIQLPGRPKMDKNGKALISPKTGRVSYMAIIDFADRGARERFQKAALPAVDHLFGAGSAP